MRIIVSVTFFVTLSVWLAPDLYADTLFRKKAAVAIGFGETGEREIRLGKLLAQGAEGVRQAALLGGQGQQLPADGE